MKKAAFFILPVFCLVFSGCSSLAEKGGQMLDGSAFAGKTVETYRASGVVLSRVRYRDKRESIVLTLKDWPTLKIFFEYEEGGENVSLYPVSCSFLCSSISGWNEWLMELSGNGSLKPDGFGGGGQTLKLNAVEMIDISFGRIRRGETRISGGEALTALKNRRNRIEALVEWMKEFSVSLKEAGQVFPVFQNQKEFETYWKPLLLPEMTAKKARPGTYSESGAVWAAAEDIKWNKNYSSSFPDDIAMLRNTGALLRDWEEALPWIYLSYQWDAIIDGISGEMYFAKTK